VSGFEVAWLIFRSFNCMMPQWRDSGNGHQHAVWRKKNRPAFNDLRMLERKRPENLFYLPSNSQNLN
jgi:hypothetical protein